MYRNKTDLGLLTLYPVTLLHLLVLTVFLWNLLHILHSGSCHLQTENFASLFGCFFPDFTINVMLAS